MTDRTQLAAKVVAVIGELEAAHAEFQETANRLVQATDTTREELVAELQGIQTRLAQLDTSLSGLQKQLDQQTSTAVTE